MRGFTLLETMVIMGILAILGSVGTLNIYGFKSEKELDLFAKELVNNLRDAQQKSITQESGEQWGIHIDASAAGNDFYQLFYGADYSSGTIVKTIVLPPNIQFTDPAPGTAENIYFAKVTGETSANSLVLGLTGSASAQYFTLNNQGVVSLAVAPPPLDLFISLSPNSGTVYQGGSVNAAVNVSLLSGVSQPSDFSVSNLPAGTGALFSPVSCTPTCSSQMTIATSGSTPAGTSAISVSATSGTLVKTANFNLTVNALAVPDAPVNLTAAAGNNQATLNWQAPAFSGGSPITNYKVYRGLSSGGETFYTNAGNVLTYTNSGLTNGTTYYYKVAAENAVGVGALSNEISVIPSAYNVSGWAWSENIGWLSFNCGNTSSCGAVSYGVSVDFGSGLMSGYAWSENIGWLSFNSSDLSGCPSGTCEARVSGGLSGSFPKNVTGWAKVLSSGGWLRLNGTTQDSNAYGVQLGSDKNFSGWSWEPEAVGWVHWKDVLYGVQGNW
ncbi:MAG: fibronectin type III domain-containing protein [Candidatus Harrisonbacteria bacterium]|nr:fibronectin type III domain-containing protein [Candidatus Harrisonbacteria bacterium]